MKRPMNDLDRIQRYLQLVILLTAGNFLMFLVLLIVVAFVSHTRGY